MLDLAEELDSIRNALSERGIEFAVCGGMAMAIHGFVRATVDLDLFVRAQDIDALRKWPLRAASSSTHTARPGSIRSTATR